MFVRMLMCCALLGGCSFAPPKTPVATQPATAPAGGTKTYPVILDRPARIGDRYALEQSITQTDTLTVQYADGPRVWETITDWRCRGEVRVTAVHQDGIRSRIEIRVDRLQKCTRQSGEPLKLEDIAAAGDVIVIDHSQSGQPGKSGPFQPVITRNGAPDERLAGLPHKLFDVAPPGGLGQPAWEVTGPQPIGARWGLDRDRFARSFEVHGGTCSPKNVSGVARLLDVRRVDGVECLEIASNTSSGEIVHPQPATDVMCVRSSQHKILPIDADSLDSRAWVATEVEARYPNEVDGEKMPCHHICAGDSFRTIKQIARGPIPSTRPAER